MSLMEQSVVPIASTWTNDHGHANRNRYMSGSPDFRGGANHRSGFGDGVNQFGFWMTTVADRLRMMNFHLTGTAKHPGAAIFGWDAGFSRGGNGTGDSSMFTSAYTQGR